MRKNEYNPDEVEVTVGAWNGMRKSARMPGMRQG